MATVNTKVTVGSTSTQILAANSRRRTAVIINDSDEVVYVSLGSAAVMNSGTRLNPNGGVLSIGAEDDYNGPVAGICASGNKNVTVCEVD